MDRTETPIAEPLFTVAALRPLGSLILFAVIAVVALAGAATVATDSAVVPATLDIPASHDEPMPTLGQ